MIIPDTYLRSWAANGGVTPYEPKMINPASIDLRLGDTIRVPMWYWNKYTWRIAQLLHDRDPKKYPLWTPEFKFKRHLMQPGAFVLCSSLEFTNIPIDQIAMLFSKSSTGRRGVEHLHAGYGDCGFSGQWTWELTNPAPWGNWLEAGKPLMQLVMLRMVEAPERDYSKTGRYQGQVGAQPARGEK